MSRGATYGSAAQRRRRAMETYHPVRQAFRAYARTPSTDFEEGAISLMARWLDRKPQETVWYLFGGRPPERFTEDSLNKHAVVIATLERGRLAGTFREFDFGVWGLTGQGRKA